MSVIMDYLSRTISGMEQFFTADKMVVLLLAVFFTLWLWDEKLVGTEGNRLIVFALVASILLLCPFTAMVGVIYQTVFYDYEWLWSMVPVTIILSYTAVLVYDTKVGKNNWKKKAPLIAVFLFLLFWCGNQGKLNTVDEETGIKQEKATRIIGVVMQESLTEEIVLWAPKSIMQETRRQTGAIKLVYGRDMWEPKAGAYDYEVYSDVLISAYEWIEDLDKFIGEEQINLSVLKIQWEELKMDVRLQEILPGLLENGVNAIVVPTGTADIFEATFFPWVKDCDMETEVEIIEDYTLYRLMQ